MEGAAPDDDVVSRVLGGDHQAFGEIVRRYQNRVFFLGRRMLRNQHEAEDYVQEVFIKAFRKLSSYRQEGHFSSWLLGLAYRHGLDSLRSRKATVELGSFDPPSPQSGPEVEGIMALSKAALGRALERLPARYRVCIDLFFYFELSYEQIREVTAIPVNTIKSHVYRAKRLLREYLKETDAEA